MEKALAEAESLLSRYEEEPEHVRHVALLSGQLFESLRHWHGRDAEARCYLHLAALLHDIGWSQSPTGRGHHKWSAKLIEQHPWKHLPPEAVPVVAQTARYHRKALPCDEHGSFRRLSAKQQRMVCELGAILRVADALDRSHAQVVREVAARVSTERIELLIAASGAWFNERVMVSRKCDLLEVASGRKVVFGEEG
jgi:exopolyphosphatase / guanosine-5'-triphosphate,3'-diphosphate pyrophosphatase